MAFPTLEDFKTPWEEKGEDLDPEKVKAFVYSKAKRAHDFEEEAKATKKTVKELETKVEGFEKAEADRARDNETAEQKAQREAQARAESDAKRDKDLADLQLELARTKVAQKTGLTEAQVKRLQGDDFDGLLKDAEAYMEENGLVAVEDGEADEANPLVRQPRIARINPGDPNPNEPKELTGEEMAVEIQKRRGGQSLF